MRIHAISDLHSDCPENLTWLEALPQNEYSADTLLVAGDVADDFQTLENTLRLLKKKFANIFFVPGNHDLWCRKNDESLDSCEKLEAVLECCRNLEIDITPRKVEEVWIVPLYSWHHQSFDREKDIEGVSIPPVDKVCMDYRVCRWPSPLSNLDQSLARYFDQLNDPFAPLEAMGEGEGEGGAQIISFSHFLPRPELCPEKRMLFYPYLPKMAGSDWLEARVRAVHGQSGSATACHVFGHTHFAWDSTLDGIRYIQAPLGYPRERERNMNGGTHWLPLLLYDSENGGLIKGPLSFRWSDYYRSNPRDPHNTKLAPWVVDRYKKVE